MVKLSKVQLRNEDLEKQIQNLQCRVIDTKAKERNLSFEKSKLLEIDRKRGLDEVMQLKEADNVISDMTNLLRKRESEINLLIEENKQLMLRYVKIEGLLSQVSMIPS